MKIDLTAQELKEIVSSENKQHEREVCPICGSQHFHKSEIDLVGMEPWCKEVLYE